MVNRRARNRMAELLDLLMMGCISQHDFSQIGGELAANSSDAGVGAVFAAADALHVGTAIPWPFSAPRAFRQPAEIQQRLAIAIVFLDSDVEYAWPLSPAQKGNWFDNLLLGVCSLYPLAGVIFLIVAMTGPALWCAIVACHCFTVPAVLHRLSYALAAHFQARWEADQAEFGDFEVWPFLRRVDFEAAHCHRASPDGSVPSEFGPGATT
jgi:hypothetical protein